MHCALFITIPIFAPNYMELHFDHLLTVDGIISLLTLTLLEIVLGIDNIIFISIISGKLPRSQQGRARFWGLLLALVMRVILLSLITYIASMVSPLFNIGTFGVTGRDLILFSGGVFLTYKTIEEIWEKISYADEKEHHVKERNLMGAILQIVLIDIVFSFDSILTAVAMSRDLVIMVSAVIVAMVIMMVFSQKVSDFINRNPSIKMLALFFLLLIGFILMADGLHFEFDKNYLYVALGFSLIVELLNMRMRKVMRNKHHHDHDQINDENK